MNALGRAVTDIVERLREATLDKDNMPRMDSERQVPVRLAKEAAEEIKRLRATLPMQTIAHLTTENDRLEDALRRIGEWSRAYPLTVFPKPDLKRARELLEAGGMTLDAISADAMRHVVEGVGDIARRALEPKP